MELKTFENELNAIASEYETLRRSRLVGGAASPSDYSDDPAHAPSSLMSLEDVASLRTNGDSAPGTEAKEVGLNGGSGEQPGEVNPRTTNCEGSPVGADDDVVDAAEEEAKEVEPLEVLSTLESLRERIAVLEPKADRFRKRLKEKDPVTGAPRYGEKTMVRVSTMIQKYDVLTDAIRIAFGSEEEPSAGKTGGGGIVGALQNAVKSEEEAQKEAAMSAAAQANASEAARLAEESRLAEQRAREEEETRLAKEREETELARRAEEARRARIEAERRAEEEARDADRAWVASIPRGADGVRAQLTALREGCASDPSGHAAAIGALHTIFNQIVARPEEVKFRRIRRDHPRFHEDVGRHAGGREVLIAAGFRLDTVDGVPCFVSREPDIERDMDGWSSWFDMLKKTLEIIEEEMVK